MPFQFIKWKSNNTLQDSIHFGENLMCHHIRENQIRAIYKQKWQRSETTKLQCESSIFPDPLRIVNKYGVVLKSIPWVSVFNAGTYNIYELIFDVTDQPDGTYFIYNNIELGGLKWEILSEPIEVAEKWSNTLSYRYKNSYNKDDVAWTTGLECLFRCESAIDGWEPDTERTNYINQIKSQTLVDGISSDQHTLYVGDHRIGFPRVADYIVKKLDIIFTQDHVYIHNKQFNIKSGNGFKINRNPDYPLISATAEIVPSNNLQSVEFSDSTPLFPGIVTAYNIETGWFGPAATVPVLEVEENG